MQIVRASAAQLHDAELLLSEYYEAVQVVQRDEPADVAAYLSGEKSGLWIAYVESLPAGCVVLRPLKPIAPAAECKRLYVRGQFRGRGIAGALLDEMEAHARRSGFEWVYLDSKDDLTEALRLYKKRGYQACARYNDNPQATVFLRKNLFT